MMNLTLPGGITARIAKCTGVRHLARVRKSTPIDFSFSCMFCKQVWFAQEADFCGKASSAWQHITGTAALNARAWIYSRNGLKQRRNTCFNGVGIFPNPGVLITHLISTLNCHLGPSGVQ